MFFSEPIAELQKSRQQQTHPCDGVKIDGPFFFVQMSGNHLLIVPGADVKKIMFQKMSRIEIEAP